MNHYDRDKREHPRGDEGDENDYRGPVPQPDGDGGEPRIDGEEADEPGENLEDEVGWTSER